MKLFKYYISIFCISICFSCSLNDQNINPDTPTEVLPEFLATQVILDVTAVSNGKWLLADSWLMKSTSFTELMEPYLYNKVDRGSFNSYLVLLDANKMIEIAQEDERMPEGELKAFLALNHFVRAYYFYIMSMDMGDIPCLDILKGESNGLFMPSYDPQETVFESIINELKESSKLFKDASLLKGDIVFQGDTDKWYRTVNSFMLRVLNMLSKKEVVGQYAVKQVFEEFAQKEIFADEESSFQRIFNKDVSSEWYPFYYEKQFYYSFPVLTTTLIEMLKELKDRRIFYYAEPAIALSDDNLENSYDAYNGVYAALDYGEIQANDKLGQYSHINERYYKVREGEPMKFIAYSETHFVLAEAALRGWNTPLTAKEHYETAVKTSMLFTSKHTPREFQHGVSIDETYINEYLNGPAKFDQSKGLKQILHQKYIASFIQFPYNSYYDYRRTGLPVLPISPSTNLNEVPTQLPQRWMYPMSEYSQNTQNIESAVSRQFDGKDETNSVMWILK